MTAARLPENLLGRPRAQGRPAVDLFSSAEHAPPEGPAIPEPEGVEIHPAARVMPMMSAAQFEGLRKSIRTHGFDPDEPLVYVLVSGPDGQLRKRYLDGRNRIAAALAEGLRLEDLPHKVFEGDAPVAYVLRRNKDRRQLTASQLAAVARDAEPLLAAEARERMAAGGRKSKQGGDDVTPPVRNERGRAAVQAAEAVGAGIAATKTMITVGKRAPELVALVKDGALKVAEAKRIASVKDDGERAEKIAAVQRGEDPAKVAPAAPRQEPNLGRMVSLLFLRCGQGPKLAPWRDLLAKVVAALGNKEPHVQHSGKRLSLDKAVELLAEKLPRPGGGT